MNRLKNYKRLQFSKEDAKIAKSELYSVLENYNENLKEKIKQEILQTYHNSLLEIERRKLAERASIKLPSIDYFVKSTLNFSFNKLHKGDRVKAYEIIDEYKKIILNI